MRTYAPHQRMEAERRATRNQRPYWIVRNSHPDEYPEAFLCLDRNELDRPPVDIEPGDIVAVVYPRGGCVTNYN